MKNSKKGISLIVLVITIIVIIILAAAVILTLNNNNPIAEANDARYASDVANMQAILTNTVSKIMTANQSTITITTTVFKDNEGDKLLTKIPYKLDYPTDEDNKSGNITFKAGTNVIPTETVKDESGNVTTKAGVLTEWVTGKALPDYTAGTEQWKVDSEGNISLTVRAGTDKATTYPASGTVVDEGAGA